MTPPDSLTELNNSETTVMSVLSAPISQAPAIVSVPTATHSDRRFAGGIAWTAAAKWSSQVFSWASLFVVARVLLPSDFGLVGMAAIYLELAQYFSEFGFGSAIVTLRDVTEEQTRQINTLCVLSGVVAFAVSCAAAVPLGLFFRAPQLPAVVVAMSATFLLSGFQTVPYSLLQKDLEFRVLSIIDASRGVAQALTVLFLALFGFGYWALVIGNLVAAATSAAVPLIFRGRGLARPHIHSVKTAIVFSWRVLVARMSWAAYSNADFLVAGRMLGSTALGFYTIAWNLAFAPQEKVTSLITQVAPAFFSAAQTDYAALRRYLCRLTEGLSLIIVPAALGLALVASELVPLALGRKWSGAIVPLELLAVFASFRSLTTLFAPVLTALGEVRFVMWYNLAALVLLSTSFYIGSREGTTGIALAWVTVYPLIALSLYRWTFRRIHMGFREYFAAVRPSLSGSLAILLFVLPLKWVLPGSWPAYVRLGLEVLTGVLTYSAVLLLFYRDRLRAFREFVQKEESLD